MARSWSEAVEAGARELVSDLGVRDFVYDPVNVRKGRATREVSDGLLLVGNRGLILQVKARDSAIAASQDRASRWVAKKVREAERQVLGTRRTMENTHLELVSHRGHRRTLEAGLSLAGVVIIEIEGVPEGMRTAVVDPRTIVMTLSDWRALNHMVRSTYGVIDYVERVIEAQVVVDLGCEEDRYRAFADADARDAGTGFPVLPTRRLTEREGELVALVAEWIDSDIATCSGSPEDVRAAIEVLDAIPLYGRVDVGEALLGKAGIAEQTRSPQSGSIVLSGSNRLVVYCDVSDNWSEEQIVDGHLDAMLMALAVVRHEHFQDAFGIGNTLLLGRVGLGARRVARSIAFLSGDAAALGIELPTEVRWEVVSQFGIVSSLGSVPASQTPREAPCPCLSGRTFAMCHGPSSRQ